ncbi:MAG: GreA/GreB family elongation factor, partial [Patescibacteria group bacterium]|nr:GreA/GreB family elongation factor [Patescibacteria group bacterium]
AKAALRRTNWQILHIEDQIKHAEIIKSGPSSTVRIGSTVVLAMDGQKIFEIVGPHETDPERGRISFESPLGSALMGHKEGDNITFNPLGKDAGRSRTCRILKIK